MVYSITTIIIFIIIFLILFSIFKKILKTLIIFIILIIIITIPIIYLTYSDLTSFKKEFPSSENLFLLEKQDNDFIAGFILLPEKNQTKLLSGEQINSINYKENKFYKTFVFNTNYLNETYTFFNKEFSGDEIKIVLNSSTPFEEAQKIIKNQNTMSLLKNTIKDKTKFKSMIFTQTLDSKNKLLTFLMEYKKGNIKVYPETIGFKIIKILPISILKNIQ